MSVIQKAKMVDAIENISIDKITPYSNNARDHRDDDIEAIMASIKEFGFLDPIGVWGENNTIVEGHGRLIAATRLGFKEVPCIRLDTLTDEQRRAYTLAHNKTAELSDWDYEILNAELDGITDINMSDFGFEFEDSIELDVEHEIQQDIVQGRVENILNLGKGDFETTGKYDIPILQPVYELPDIKEWIPFNYVLSDKEPEGKAVHFFIDDYQFERLFRQPEKYIEKLRQYVAVATPDFSPYSDMPNVCQMYNHYRKHWVGAYLQAQGLTVIPTIRASRDERSFEWYLDGEPEGGIVLISAMWTSDDESREYFYREYGTMYETLKPCKVLLYGGNDKITGLQGDIEHLKTFTQNRWER